MVQNIGANVRRGEGLELVSSIAAMAALFAVLKGVNLGGRPIPEDYLEELRDGLGVSGGFVKADSNVGSKPVDASIKVYEFASFGSMRLRVSGEVPGEFLRKSGVSLPSDYAGGFSREFVLKNLEKGFLCFWKLPRAQGFPCGSEHRRARSLYNWPMRVPSLGLNLRRMRSR